MNDKSLSAMMTFRNCIENGYPFVEAILSILPIIDEYHINDGGSTDGTLEIAKRLTETFPKITLHRIKDYKSARWNCVGEQYNKLKEKCTGEFVIQGDADELVSEKDIYKLRDALRALPDHVDVVRLNRREVRYNWHDLSRPYWGARICRNKPEIRQIWEIFGGDEFVDGTNKWIRDGIRDVKLDITLWHFYVMFPGNMAAKRRNDAEFIATKDIYRVDIYKKLKNMTPGVHRNLSASDDIPKLMVGHVGSLKYEFREKLLDRKWLKEVTGIEY